MGPQRYVLATSSLCLLSVVVPARDLKRLPARLSAAVSQTLAHIGVQAAVASREIAAMNEIRVAGTNSRTVLGSMAHLAVQAGDQLYDLPHRPGRALPHVNAWLAQVPCSALRYATPADVAVRLLEGFDGRLPGQRRHGRVTSIHEAAALLD